MRLALALALAAVPAAPLAAQTVLSDYESAARAKEMRANTVWRLAFRPTLMVLEQAVAILGRDAPPAARTRAEALVAEAKGKDEPTARRLLTEAAAVLQGQAWSPDTALVDSLSIRPERAVLDGGRQTVTIAALYPTSGAKPARYTIDLLRAEPTSSATPRRGALVRRLASGSVGALPARPGVALTGVEDGVYILLATFRTASGAVSEAAAPVYLVRDLAARHARVRTRLARIAGHEAARQTAEYPYALAEAINAGTREVIAYDFAAAMTRSDAIVTALEQGRDPVARATGLQDRAYRFADTGELVPYQLYVPKAWTPGRAWPLVVALHGANLDERNMLGRADARMQALAEQHGMIVVAPLGYRINSGYGSERGLNVVIGDDAMRRRRSEQDVLAVADLIAAEYGTDPARTYLTGNSMGGAGTWWIGGHHPDRWAAIAPAAYGGVTAADVAGLSKLPILAVVGEKDELGMADRVRASVAVLKAGGVEPQLLVVPGGTHASGFDIAMPKIFDFFESHRR
ncbi:alpha/beta hydrolase-fold protein [Sphingomonas adhaesiva]|uniref:carboxylesterase family protein n=1 Tax=Sphingomonas adhaesiva TaxID=28212 RepID=UPI002FFC045A